MQLPVASVRVPVYLFQATNVLLEALRQNLNQIRTVRTLHGLNCMYIAKNIIN